MPPQPKGGRPATIEYTGGPGITPNRKIVFSQHLRWRRRIRRRRVQRRHGRSAPPRDGRVEAGAPGGIEENALA